MSDAVVAITDAGPLGRAMALTLAARGHRIAVYHDPLAQPNAEALIDELGADRVFAHVVEVGHWDTFDRAWRATQAAFATPTHAVLSYPSARQGGGPLHLGGHDDGGLYRHVTVGHEALYRTMRIALAPMVVARRGSVIVLGDRSGERPWEHPGDAIHASSSSAAIALVRTVAEEVREHRVRVNAILTTVIDTPRARDEMPGFDPENWISVDAVAATVAFLVSDDAVEITGALIPMYGRV